MNISTIDTRPAAGASRANPLWVLLLAWLGQSLSGLTVGMTAFGLSVWTYENSGSLLLFSLTTLFSLAPALLIGPWAGSLADRSSRRRLIVAADLIMLSACVLMAVLDLTHQLRLWHIYANTALGAAALAVRLPAFMATMSAILPPDQLSRSGGLIWISNSAVGIAAPALAGWGLASWGLGGMILLNIPAFALALASLVLLRWPDQAAPAPKRKRTTLADMREALGYLRRHPGLLTVSGYGALAALIAGFALTLNRPMLLAAFSVEAMATVQTAAGAGAFLGAALMIAHNPSRRLVLIMFSADIGFGLVLACAGLTQSFLMMCAVMFLSGLLVPLSQCCGDAFWQRRIPQSLQGRVTAFNRMLASSATPLAALLGSTLADTLFEPWLMPSGALSQTLGPWLGTGKGRGIALMFLVAGTMLACLGLLALSRRTLRRLPEDAP